MTDWSGINNIRLAEVHPVLRTRVQALLADMLERRIPILVTDGYRSYVEQMALYNRGRNLKGEIVDAKAVVTKAKPGMSMHQYGLAVDLVPDDVTLAGYQADWNADHPVWKQLLEVAPSHDLAEGALWRTFPDRPHFYPKELPANPTTEMQMMLVTGGGVEKVWEWFDQQLAPPPPSIPTKVA